MKAPFFLALLLLIAGCTASPEPESDTATSAYTGEQHRALKALSAEDVEAYRTGQGMGLAKAAELNQYPGPRHVLDLADNLNLTDEQRAQTQQAFDAMKAEAVRLGEHIVAHETTLDALFAEEQADADTLQALLRELGTLQADLRFVHLNAHLAMKTILDDAQITQYNDLRGYSDAEGGEHDHSRMHH